MLISYFILWLVIGLSIVFYLGFFLKNKNFKNRHSEIKEKLENHIVENLNQITRRQEKLELYDFLKYNLKQALFVQEEIIL